METERSAFSHGGARNCLCPLWAIFTLEKVQLKIGSREVSVLLHSTGLLYVNILPQAITF